MAKNVIQFIDKQTNRRKMGENARRYYENRFEKTLFMDKLEEELNGEIVSI